MTLSIEQAQAVIWRENPDWKQVPGTQSIEEEYKDVLSMYAIYEYIPTGKFYAFNWEKGTYYNENLDPEDMFGWNETEVIPIEVHQVEKTVKIWESIQNQNA